MTGDNRLRVGAQWFPGWFVIVQNRPGRPVEHPYVCERLYIRTRSNCAMDFTGSGKRAEIRAKLLAPTSMTDRARSTAIPPIATKGLFVNERASRTPSRPTTGSGFTLLTVANTGPMAM